MWWRRWALHRVATLGHATDEQLREALHTRITDAEARADRAEQAARAVDCLAMAYADYCERNPDPDQIPEPWVEFAQEILGHERANEIHDRAVARAQVRLDEW